ncbi:sulfite exporter TauE/SafE family protein [Reinekea marinisedimentorum]|uniref:Probable membrane transporter protein n=1 Tax=Reinekea marinisedimentorum TaxID=230495 RepID=A0A4V2UIB1_9GAMM|nr:sulfite exporter TauE/SafE family protein [Reinekea marinisedimentorum]TCS34791.1 putative membrane protein YfcA [Reinekea marinisedimentorum]
MSQIKFEQCQFSEATAQKSSECDISGALNSKVLGWEVAQAQDLQSIKDRMRFNRPEIVAVLIALGMLSAVFILSCWLAENPFQSTQHIESIGTLSIGWHETNSWRIVWTVVLLAIVFELLDSSAGMGYGTAFTPILLVMGYELQQIVPAIMIQQASAGLISAYIHNEFKNVEWRFHPISETVRLWLMISGIGILAVAFSVTSIYGWLSWATTWIKLYVIILLLIMGAAALINANRKTEYHPKRMLFFGALAGFNKGIGGGGYGPVLTIGGIRSGVPLKTMMAITALSEGTVCIASIITWFLLSSSGVIIDFILLPSMILGSIIAVIAGPYVTRVLPDNIWRKVVPIYCCLLALFCLIKLFPAFLIFASTS